MRNGHFEKYDFFFWSCVNHEGQFSLKLNTYKGHFKDIFDSMNSFGSTDTRFNIYFIALVEWRYLSCGNTMQIISYILWT